MENKRASVQRSAKAAAILYIQSQAGMQAVKAGDTIRYCAPAEGASYTDSTFVVGENDLQLVAAAHRGEVELAPTPQDRRTARIV